MNIQIKEKQNKYFIFKKFGPAFLVLALGIGSGELILWPYFSANYGFGLLWAALLGISLQLALIYLISRNTIIFKKNILEIFALVFPGIFLWIIFSTIIGFGWPGFSSLPASILIDWFQFEKSNFIFLASGILIFSSMLLIFSKSVYKIILKFEKILMSLFLIFILGLFVYFFNSSEFLKMIGGIFGIGENYYFIPESVGTLFLATFFGAIAYAGSGGNLLLLNSFYLRKELKNENYEIEKENKKVLEQNIIFFWFGGFLIILILSYLSKVLLYGGGEKIEENFSFLIHEGRILNEMIGFGSGDLFILFSVLAVIGVQFGILDFIGRISILVKNNWKKIKDKISDKKIYNLTIFSAMVFGLLVFALGVEKPKTLIVLGSVINAFSMGVIALLLLLVELKILDGKFRLKKNLWILSFTTLFYFLFFFYVVLDKIIL